MTEVRKTGNLRLRRQIIGKAGTLETLLNTSDINELQKNFHSYEYDENYEYFCEEEVVYIKNHWDSYGNPINSAPTWRRFNCKSN